METVDSLPLAASGPAGAVVSRTNFGDVLRELLLHAGMSQSELARRCGVNHTTVSRLCGGSRLPELTTLARIIDQLDLIGTDNEMALAIAAIDSARVRERYEA